jgi:hypothetical protein
MDHTNKADVLRQGAIIFIFLAVLTGLEFFVAVEIGAIALLGLDSFSTITCTFTI